MRRGREGKMGVRLSRIGKQVRYRWTLRRWRCTPKEGWVHFEEERSMGRERGLVLRRLASLRETDANLPRITRGLHNSAYRPLPHPLQLLPLSLSLFQAFMIFRSERAYIRSLSLPAAKPPVYTSIRARGKAKSAAVSFLACERDVMKMRRNFLADPVDGRSPRLCTPGIRRGSNSG